jgi:hypothetical protein
MMEYKVLKSEKLVIHQVSSEIENEVEVFTIDCQSCKKCDAYSLVCDKLTNGKICSYIKENFEICKQNALRSGDIVQKKLAGIQVCCRFDMN